MQFSVQLGSQRLCLLRCSFMKGGVTVDDVLCNLFRNADRKGLGHIKFHANANLELPKLENCETSCRWGCYTVQR